MLDDDANRPRRRRFRGSKAEWLAGYAALFFIGGIVGLTVAIDEYALVCFSLAIVLGALSIFVWKRRKEDEE